MPEEKTAEEVEQETKTRKERNNPPCIIQALVGIGNNEEDVGWEDIHIMENGNVKAAMKKREELIQDGQEMRIIRVVADPIKCETETIEKKSFSPA